VKDDFTNQITCGDCLTVMQGMPDEYIQMVVTSPPYWGLRKYSGDQDRIWGGDSECSHVWGDTMVGGEGYANGAKKRWQHVGGRKEMPANGFQKHTEQGVFCQHCGAWKGSLGLEPIPDCAAWATGQPLCSSCYVCHIIEIFKKIKRVLRSDGTVWLNLGDSYAGGNYRGGGIDTASKTQLANAGTIDFMASKANIPDGLKPKDMVGAPWRVAFALQADGWWLRSDIIWAKPDPMPESVTDRPTKSHEHLFLLSKNKKYYYDADAIREPNNPDGRNQTKKITGKYSHENYANSAGRELWPNLLGRNKRNVWTISKNKLYGAHFATFPLKLVEPCVLAGSSPKACGVCGSPWERVVERKSLERYELPQEHPMYRPTRSESKYEAIYGKTGTAMRHHYSKTIGWQPTCKCTPPDDTGKSIVLDPFIGSGTTAIVSANNGRDYVGIDISQEYVNMAEKRIAVETKQLDMLAQIT